MMGEANQNRQLGATHATSLESVDLELGNQSGPGAAHHEFPRPSIKRDMRSTTDYRDSLPILGIIYMTLAAFLISFRSGEPQYQR